MNTNLTTLNASILDSGADIIVMSANPSLLAGSGVSGVIHKSAGPELERHAKPLGPLAVGQAVVTPAFEAQAKYIVHAVCPRYYDGQRGESEELRQAYQNALSVCDKLTDVRSIAFVSMGTGVYKWPIELACKIAVSELMKSQIQNTFVCIQDQRLLIEYQLEISRHV
ncbi:macro domain-containing protein [Porticoccaceae bacterium]|nr:macro domain-containing protein [Porticoccaceae bacterium]